MPPMSGNESEPKSDHPGAALVRLEPKQDDGLFTSDDDGAIVLHSNTIGDVMQQVQQHVSDLEAAMAQLKERMARIENMERGQASMTGLSPPRAPIHNS